MANPEPAPVDGAVQTPVRAPAVSSTAEGSAVHTEESPAASVGSVSTAVVTETPVISAAPASAPALTSAPLPIPSTAPAAKCGNCGTELRGAFCHECGQKDFDFRRSFGAVFAELFETFLNFDGKLLRGMYALLFQPGKLTVDFLAGKRTSQVPPLRFYIFLSIVTFVWASSGEQTNIQVAQGLDKELAAKSELQRAEVRASPIMQRLELASKHPDEINRMFRDTLPQMFLLCVPLLAFLLWAVFRRQRYAYLQHLVAAVHLQTFVLLVGVTAAGWGRIFGLVWGSGYQAMRLVGFLYFFVHSFLALRRIYGEPAALTVVKGLGVLAVYWVSLMFAMAGVLVLALLQL